MADVFANSRSILHKGDGNQHVSGPPDVCKTPSPGGPVPIPYPNIAMDSDLAKGTKKVKINGKSVATEAANLSTSTGDEAGTAGGGLISSKTKGKLTWGSASTDVIAEGNGVARFMDVTQHNGNIFNTAITALGSATTPGYGDDPADGPNCMICGEDKAKHRLESDNTLADLAAKLAKDLKGKFANEQKAYDEAEIKKALAKAERDRKAGKDKEVKIPDRKKGYMLGVLICQCKSPKEPKKYAGLSSGRKGGNWDKCKAEFNAAAGRLGLTPVVVPPQPPPLSGNNPSPNPPPVFGAITEGAWTAAKAAVEKAQGGPNIGLPPLVCAAPKIIQKCLDEGHKPAKLLEIWLNLQPETDDGVKIRDFVHVVYDFAVPTRNSPQVATGVVRNHVFKDGDAVPSCTTCQVLLTGMVCRLGEAPC